MRKSPISHSNIVIYLVFVTGLLAKNSKDLFDEFKGYDVDLPASYAVGAKKLAKVALDVSDASTDEKIREKCGNKCVKKFDDCNIIVFWPESKYCYLLNCGLDASLCYFNSVSSEHSPVVMQRLDKFNKVDSEETSHGSSTDEQQRNKDFIQFAPSSNTDGKDPSIESPFQQTPDASSQCEQPMRIGPCRAAMPRYYYDTEAKKCKLFIYGGCNGNENNFKTEEGCIAVCVHTGKDEVTGGAVDVEEESEETSSSVKFFNDSSHEDDPINEAHRQSAVRLNSNLGTTYELEAVVPLFAGVVISVLMLFVILFRCYSNTKKGPTKLRKFIDDGPPTVGEFFNEDDVVNGMYT